MLDAERCQERLELIQLRREFSLETGIAMALGSSATVGLCCLFVSRRLPTGRLVEQTAPEPQPAR